MTTVKKKRHNRQYVTIHVKGTYDHNKERRQLRLNVTIRVKSECHPHDNTQLPQAAATNVSP